MRIEPKTLGLKNLYRSHEALVYRWAIVSLYPQWLIYKEDVSMHTYTDNFYSHLDKEYLNRQQKYLACCLAYWK